VVNKVLADLPAAELYAMTGLQVLPFNTIYQLVAAAGSPQLAAAQRMLLIPDLLAFWLTGVQMGEVTNASTTQLLDVRRRQWSAHLVRRIGVDSTLFPALVEPGEQIGELEPSTVDGLDESVPVIAVGSHDTASAVVGVPARGRRFAYISSGTWSLVEVELDQPIRSEASRQANFTNELGVDRTVRYLRNVMGLWLLQESLRTWRAAGMSVELEPLLHEAATIPAFTALVDADDPAFLPPGNMPARITDVCRRLDQPVPAGPAAVVRCIVDSLALAYRCTIRQVQQLSGIEVDVIHVVGGGSRNALLCQLTADACGLPVVAGPVEATALGNVLVQARALGAIDGGLAELRALLRDTTNWTATSPTVMNARGRPPSVASAHRR
jgi:rhamnulokinase